MAAASLGVREQWPQMLQGSKSSAMSPGGPGPADVAAARELRRDGGALRFVGSPVGGQDLLRSVELMLVKIWWFLKNQGPHL